MTSDGAKPEICGKETELRVLEGESGSQYYLIPRLLSAYYKKKMHCYVFMGCFGWGYKSYRIMQYWLEFFLSPQERRRSSTGRRCWRVVRTGRPGGRGRGAEGLAAQGAVATEEERGDKNIRLPRTEREREGRLPQLPSNPRQKTKKTRII